MMNPFSVLLSCLPLLLAGCAGLPTDTPAEQVVESPAPLYASWWQEFNDPLMEPLAGHLMEQNLDIQIAKSRLQEARALAVISRSGFFPDISATGTAMRGNQELPGLATILQGGFNATWELDVFGRTRADLRAAEARINAQAATVEDIRRILLADLLRAVILWRQAQQTIEATTNLLSVQDSQIDLLQAQAESGLIDNSFVQRAQAQRAQTAIQFPLAEAMANAALYQIEQLLGTQGDHIADLVRTSTPHTLTVPSPQTVTSLSLDTIKRRADIRAAYASMQAAQADLDKAEADLWPRLTVSGFFGVRDTSGNTLSSGNPVWSLASGITAPLLNFGRLRGAVKAADARTQQAALYYENTVLLALQEAKTALSDYLNGINATYQQAETLRHRQETVAIAQERFERGLTDMTDLTTAQAELDQATIALIQQKADAAIAYIRFRKALGML